MIGSDKSRFADWTTERIQTVETDAVFPHAYTFANGYLHPGDTPGHGVDLDEQLAARYPYRPSTLPVNRLEDGTMWNW